MPVAIERGAALDSMKADPQKRCSEGPEKNRAGNGEPFSRGPAFSCDPTLTMEMNVTR